MVYLTIIIICVAVFAVSSFHVTAFKSAMGPPLKGTSSSASSRTTLFAEKKVATKKKSATDDDAAEKFKKADFVSAVAEKTGMTKVQSELAMTAVLDVLSTVRSLLYIFAQFNQDYLCSLSSFFYSHAHHVNAILGRK
jgi:predicted homoserine dehydrogenase-like protein